MAPPRRTPPSRPADIEKGNLKDEVPLACEVIHTLSSKRALSVALLLHDVAKGRGGDHSILGAKVAEKLCPRLGMTEEETETVAWLVRQHLTMSIVAFKRDWMMKRQSGLHRHREVARTPEAAAGPDGGRHPCRGSRPLEQLEGDAAAPAVLAVRGNDVRRRGGGRWA
ncbi:HD domain-containing protein [Azospirillum sp. B4]|uniref:HD domain-containing protein n=1 Tax=Azospirillum sp. B4 TaxID=95605 RepID=UPI00207874CF|nr:HD domain-containing protein [Azospirillum sp. B4]